MKQLFQSYICVVLKQERPRHVYKSEIELVADKRAN